MGRGAGRLAGALSWHIKIRGTEPGTPRAGPRAWVVRTQGPTEPSAPSLALGGTRVRQAADRERTIVTMSALYGLPHVPPHSPSAGCTWEDRRQHRAIWVFALLSLVPGRRHGCGPGLMGWCGRAPGRGGGLAGLSLRDLPAEHGAPAPLPRPGTYGLDGVA